MVEQCSAEMRCVALPVKMTMLCMSCSEVSMPVMMKMMSEWVQLVDVK
jgi:hypothetical protein